MSVTLGALVIAISTEFSVLLSERFRAERARRRSTSRAALAATYRSTGARGARLRRDGDRRLRACSCVSDIRMLRDFGVVTVVDLAVSLLGVLVVLPAVLVLAERGALRAGGSRRALRRRAARAGAAAPRGRARDRRASAEPPARFGSRGCRPRRARGDRRRSACSSLRHAEHAQHAGAAALERPARSATPMPPFAAPLALVAPARAT